jgi:hypothetical protein
MAESVKKTKMMTTTKSFCATSMTYVTYIGHLTNSGCLIQSMKVYFCHCRLDNQSYLSE